jgi:hypothetical protein
MSLPVRTQKHIWGLFAGRCAICRVHLVHDEIGTSSLLGEIAHIVGDKRGAARGDHPMALQERSLPDNLMLLCQAHHKLIDDNPVSYPVETLHKIRQSFLGWLSQQLAPRARWSTTISQYLYINVPRMDEFSVLSGFALQRPPETDIKSLHQAGRSMAAFMQCYREAFESAHVASVNLNDVRFAHEDYLGQIVAFDGWAFRSQGLPYNRDDYFGSPDPSAKPRRPSLSIRNHDFTLSIAIDSRWITTNTAYLLFTPQSRMVVLSGVARIISVDYSLQTLFATALVLGVPSSGYNRQPSKIAGFDAADMSLGASHPEDDVRSEDDQEQEEGDRLRCGVCEVDLAQEEYITYGKISDEETGWATLCSACVSSRGTRFNIRQGQVFRRDEKNFVFFADLPGVTT